MTHVFHIEWGNIEGHILENVHIKRKMSGCEWGKLFNIHTLLFGGQPIREQEMKIWGVICGINPSTLAFNLFLNKFVSLNK